MVIAERVESSNVITVFMVETNPRDLCAQHTAPAVAQCPAMHPDAVYVVQHYLVCLETERAWTLTV